MTSPLLEACESCRKKTEQSLDNLLRINQELQSENDTLRAKPQPSLQEADLNRLIDLVAEDIEWKEARLTPRTDPRIVAIIEAYRKISPKETRK